MQRIIVIGCPGSGKTTFASKLRDRLGYPLFYLDSIWHRADRTHISRDEFDERLSEILPGERWIIDGNYSRTLERRLLACDTVFLFDLPTDVCLSGAEARVGKERPDMPWVENKLDPQFKAVIEEFKTEKLPDIYALIERCCGGKAVYVFKSREEAQSFLCGL